tara:strand:+ start:310 stop:840 length:531 start_codon:yes stop_codon:yes gene_type:complete
MKKRAMIKQLIKLATHLDSGGLSKEADAIDAIIRKLASTDEALDQEEKEETKRLVELLVRKYHASSLDNWKNEATAVVSLLLLWDERKEALNYSNGQIENIDTNAEYPDELNDINAYRAIIEIIENAAYNDDTDYARRAYPMKSSPFSRGELGFSDLWSDRDDKGELKHVTPGDNE